VPCTIPVKVGEEDRIFGSVTDQEIAGFLQKEGFDIEKNNVELEEPIKQLGVYTVTVVLYKDVSAKLKVWVVKEEQK
jgi:large subunit ribosomal protein L9